MSQNTIRTLSAITTEDFVSLLRKREFQELEVRTSRTNQRCEIKISGGDFKKAAYHIQFDTSPPPQATTTPPLHPSSSSSSALTTSGAVMSAVPTTSSSSPWASDTPANPTSRTEQPSINVHSSSPARLRPSSASSNTAAATNAAASSMPFSSPDRKGESNDGDRGDANSVAMQSSRMLMSLIPRFRASKTLVSLNLGGNKLQDDAAVRIADVLLHNKVMMKLGIAANKIGPDGIARISEALKNNSTLHTLDISSNSIFNEGCVAIAGMLRVNTGLQSLEMAHTESYAVGCEEIFKSLEENKTLTRLGISRNFCLARGGEVLGRALGVNRALTELDLSTTFLFAEGVQHVAQGLVHNKTLRFLNLSGNEAEDVGMKALTVAMKENTALEMLNVQNNLFTAPGFKPLAKAIRKHNRSLKSLLIGDNELGSKGAETLGKLLKSNETLTELHANGTSIEGRHLRNFAEGMRANKALKILNLSYNDIGNTGAVYLKLMLCEADECVLEDLRLTRCHIGDRGIFSIAEALMTNQSLTSVSMRWNRFKNQGVDSMLGALRDNFKLCYLQVLSPGIHSASLVPLEVFLRRNRDLQRAQCQMAFCMGFHPRLGAASPLANDFSKSVIYDCNVLRFIWDYAFKML